MLLILLVFKTNFFDYIVSQKCQFSVKEGALEKYNLIKLKNVSKCIYVTRANVFDLYVGFKFYFTLKKYVHSLCIDNLLCIVLYYDNAL